MFNKWIRVLILSVSFLSLTITQNSHAFIGGAVTGNFLLILGGASMLGGGTTLVLGSQSLMDGDSRNVRDSREWIGLFGTVMAIVGLGLDADLEKNTDKMLLSIDVGKDLGQKVADEVYSEDEAKEILDDYLDYQKKFEQKSQRIAFTEADKKTGKELSQELILKTGLKEVTAKYFISSLGIQTE